MTNQQQITAGPSREELFDALRLRHEGRKVSFTISCSPRRPGSQIKKLSETFDVFINGIGIEDGSGNNWVIEIYDPLDSEHLKVYFNTTRREGCILSAST